MMQRSLRLLLKRGIVLSTLSAIGCVALFATLGMAQSASTQSPKRSFESKIPPHVPIKIKIKKEKEEKALDPNNKNWFRDIEIEFTNSSDKPIYYLSLFLEMPDLSQVRPGVNKVFLLKYGRGDFIEQNTKPIPEDIPIEPKATYTFVLDANQMGGYENWRTRNNSKDPVKLEIWLNHLSYGDGTGFTTLGALPFPFKNNPEEMGRCSPKARAPDEWATRPEVFSSLLAQNLVEPASFVPVNFYSKNNAAPSEILSPPHYQASLRRLSI